MEIKLWSQSSKSRYVISIHLDLMLSKERFSSLHSFNFRTLSLIYFNYWENFLSICLSNYHIFSQWGINAVKLVILWISWPSSFPKWTLYMLSAKLLNITSLLNFDFNYVLRLLFYGFILKKNTRKLHKGRINIYKK